MKRLVEDHATTFNIRDPDFNEPYFVYDVYEKMRERADIVHSDHPTLDLQTSRYADGHWEAIGYDVCGEIAHDWPRFTSNAPSVYPDLPPKYNFIFLDPPVQQDYRKLVNIVFSPRRIERAEVAACRAASALLDSFIEEGQGDLATVAWGLPGIVLFTEILGLPEEEVPTCVDLSKRALHSETEADRNQGSLEFNRYVVELIEAKAKEPRQDKLLDLFFTTTAIGDQNLSFDAICEHAQILVAAGLETTSGLLTSAYHYLAQHPDERQRLVTNASLMHTAVEEFLRFMGSVHGLGRVVAIDTEVAGCSLKRGDLVQLNYAAANRDPRRFPNADRMVLDRQENAHLAFGIGPHRCLGSNLARMEFRVGLEEVLRRIPDYRVPDESKCEFVGNSITFGFTSLPTTFTPGPRVGPRRQPADT